MDGNGSWLDALLAGSWVVVRRVSSEDRLYFELEEGEPAAPLTEQERRVVALVARCASHAEIGFDLGIGVTTVSTHLCAGLRKLGLHRVDLPVLAAASPDEPRAARGGARVSSPSSRVAHLEELTAAERDVVRLVLLGATNAEIAAARASSIRTVANQLASILRKLGAPSRLGVVREVLCRAAPAQLSARAGGRSNESVAARTARSRSRCR